jgi:hypothetical protein
VDLPRLMENPAGFPQACDAQKSDLPIFPYDQLIDGHQCFSTSWGT